MWLDDLFPGEWKFSMAVVPIFLLCIAPTEASYEFPAYRMYQYDYQSADVTDREAFGSSVAQVSFEGRAPDAKQITRKNVVMNLLDITSKQSFNSLLEKNPGSVLIILPDFMRTEDFRNVTKETLDQIAEAERALLDFPVTQIPIYFSYETAELKQIQEELKDLSDMSGASAVLYAGSAVLHQFSVTQKQPEVLKAQLDAIESRLDGISGSPTILVTTKMDAFASSFALARGANSAASGLGVTLEIARSLSMLFIDDSTRPQYNILFAIMPADSINYVSTRNWLDAKDKNENSATLKNIHLAICLDALGSSSDGKLYAHVSKRPADGTLGNKFLKSLEAAASVNSLELELIHKKINIQDESRKWQHERFAFKKVPSITLSTFADPESPNRRSLADFSSRIDKHQYATVTKTIGAGLLNTLYKNKAITHGIEVNGDAAFAWVENLSASQSSAGNFTKRSFNDIKKHMDTFTSNIELVNVGQGIDLYNTHEVVMSQFLVRPPIFDLYLGSVVGLWLGLVYLLITNFNEIIACLKPILSRPDLIKGKKIS